MMYRLGLYEKAMPADIGFSAMLRAAKAAGFDFLEISIDETDARLARLDWTRAERDQLIREMRSEQLPIRTMCLSGQRKYPLGSRDRAVCARSKEIFKKAVQLADDLGVRIIQLAGYDVYYEQGGADTAGRFLDNLRECVRYAGQYGVTLGFETMETPFMDTVSKAMSYVEQINSPYLGLYPDLGNLSNAAQLYGSDLYADLAGGGGHLLAMHVKETRPGQYRDMRFGEGCVDFERGLSAARALGVNLFVAECWHDGRENWQQGLAEVSSFIRGKM